MTKTSFQPASRDLAGYVKTRTAFRPPTTIPGRQWITHFEAAQATSDNAVWTLTNLTRTTDGSRSAAKMTSLATSASCLTKETVRDVDVLVRWRAADTDATYHLGYLNIALHARRVADSDRISFDYDPGHSVARPIALTNYAGGGLYTFPAGGFNPAPSDLSVNNTNVTDDRYMRIRTVGGGVFIKHWFATALEPDWETVRLARGGNTPAGDNIESGNAGFEMLYNGGFVYELTVTELLPTAEMVISGRMAPTDTNTGLPVGFTTHGTAGGGTTTLNTPAVVDPWGTTRKVLHIVKPSTTGYDGTNLRIYNSRRRGQVYSTRRSPEPFVPFTSMVRVSVWSKGTNIVNPSPSAVNLGAACVIYYYDLASVAQNQADSQYYRALGPTAVTNPPIGETASGPGGIGTWDWFETTWVMPIFEVDDIGFMDIFIGFHDPASATGEFWVSDLSITPVIS